MVQFSKRTENQQKHHTVNILQVHSSNKIVSYLGFQNINQRRTRRNFLKILERITSKIDGMKILLQAGKTVFTKSKLTSIPFYTMQAIKIHEFISNNKQILTWISFGKVIEYLTSNIFQTLEYVYKNLSTTMWGDSSIRKARNVNTALLAIY